MVSSSRKFSARNARLFHLFNLFDYLIRIFWKSIFLDKRFRKCLASRSRWKLYISFLSAIFSEYFELTFLIDNVRIDHWKKKVLKRHYPSSHKDIILVLHFKTTESENLFYFSQFSLGYWKNRSLDKCRRTDKK